MKALLNQVGSGQVEFLLEEVESGKGCQSKECARCKGLQYGVLQDIFNLLPVDLFLLLVSSPWIYPSSIHFRINLF